MMDTRNRFQRFVATLSSGAGHQADSGGPVATGLREPGEALREPGEALREPGEALREPGEALREPGERSSASASSSGDESETCSLCGRQLLIGERPHRLRSDKGVTLLCPLCSSKHAARTQAQRSPEPAASSQRPAQRSAQRPASSRRWAQPSASGRRSAGRTVFDERDEPSSLPAPAREGRRRATAGKTTKAAYRRRRAVALLLVAALVSSGALVLAHSDRSHAGQVVRQPGTVALGSVNVRHGALAVVHFRILEPGKASVAATIVIRNAAGAVVKTVKLGTVATNRRLSSRFLATLSPGRYTYRVIASIGGRVSSGSASPATLVVRQASR